MKSDRRSAIRFYGPAGSQDSILVQIHLFETQRFAADHAVPRRKRPVALGVPPFRGSAQFDVIARSFPKALAQLCVHYDASLRHDLPIVNRDNAKLSMLTRSQTPGPQGFRRRRRLLPSGVRRAGQKKLKNAVDKYRNFE